MKRNEGISVVEFTIVSSALFILIFGIIEIGLYMYSLQRINEMTRIAARLGVVCNVGDQDDIPALAVPDDAPGGFAPENLSLGYLDSGGSPIVGDPDADEDVFLTIRYVRAEVVDFEYQFSGLLSFFQGAITVPNFETTLPRENLGEIRGSVTDTDC
ncbi:pilus assembly protein [Vibrio sp. ZSDE26]|uniref:Pilus assembly protein n=1 Tax=Vibrio amylolyticus TaxID=2847292 RepID=A0A9X2BII2_9VIBR|nr:TadE family protein [Vibrio amylolyticus]MCK6262462.1 pilus assembly protein [Vibrio amylolyticus]